MSPANSSRRSIRPRSSHTKPVPPAQQIRPPCPHSPAAAQSACARRTWRPAAESSLPLSLPPANTHPACRIRRSACRDPQGNRETYHPDAVGVGAARKEHLDHFLVADAGGSGQHGATRLHGKRGRISSRQNEQQQKQPFERPRSRSSQMAHHELVDVVLALLQQIVYHIHARMDRGEEQRRKVALCAERCQPSAMRRKVGTPRTTPAHAQANLDGVLVRAGFDQKPHNGEVACAISGIRTKLRGRH